MHISMMRFGENNTQIRNMDLIRDVIFYKKFPAFRSRKAGDSFHMPKKQIFYVDIKSVTEINSRMKGY